MTFQTFDDLGQQITRIDTAMVHEGLAACYLLGGGDEYAIIETGTHNTVPTIFALLKERNIDLAKVKYVIPTHVHLDHAGGVGGLALLADAKGRAGERMGQARASFIVDPASRDTSLGGPRRRLAIDLLDPEEHARAPHYRGAADDAEPTEVGVGRVGLLEVGQGNDDGGVVRVNGVETPLAISNPKPTLG